MRAALSELLPFILYKAQVVLYFYMLQIHYVHNSETPKPSLKPNESVKASVQHGYGFQHVTDDQRRSRLKVHPQLDFSQEIFSKIKK